MSAKNCAWGKIEPRGKPAVALLCLIYEMGSLR
jgi:hypothetical protein